MDSLSFFGFVFILHKSHSTLNCMCFWSGPLFNHDQAFRSLSHCSGGNKYEVTSHVLCFQFYDTFATHFSPHQFRVVTKGSYEVVIHDIRCTLDLHPNWVVLQLDMANAFNLVSRKAIFQELLCNRWRHHTIHPLCSCILCI